MVGHRRARHGLRAGRGFDLDVQQAGVGLAKARNTFQRGQGLASKRARVPGARIQPGHWFAMRNSDYRLTKVLVRVAPLPAGVPPRRMLVEIAAA